MILYITDLDYDMIDDSTILSKLMVVFGLYVCIPLVTISPSIGEEDFRAVFRAVEKVEARYFHLGVELGLQPHKLEAIQKAYGQDISQACNQVLLLWLRQSYNTEKYGSPTWRRLVEAVDNSAGGANHALAKTIATQHLKGMIFTNIMYLVTKLTLIL